MDYHLTVMTSDTMPCSSNYLDLKFAEFVSPEMNYKPPDIELIKGALLL